MVQAVRGVLAQCESPIIDPQRHASLSRSCCPVSTLSDNRIGIVVLNSLTDWMPRATETRWSGTLQPLLGYARLV